MTANIPALFSLSRSVRKNQLEGYLNFHLIIVPTTANIFPHREGVDALPVFNFKAAEVLASAFTY